MAAASATEAHHPASTLATLRGIPQGGGGRRSARPERLRL